MKAGFHQDYPASPERLWQVFGQPDYPHRKYAAQGITAYCVRQFDVSADRISLDLERTLAVPVERIPHFVQRFVHPEQVLHYVSHWHRDAGGHCSFDLKILLPGLPVSIEGRGELRQSAANASRLSIDFDIRVPVPLLGGKIEKLLAGFIEKSFRDDHAFTLQYLAEAG
ncbi:MAG: hypothetical protein K0R03_1918 [Moraxellaceae bacterium]|jgi:hypothetical protein|nr:hypothetical protein [Moraxellaceae bacterium]MDF3031360.1 hypothetical protein [Moraxellaceae bacterium]